jgi:general secretion pathway protein M
MIQIARSPPASRGVALAILVGLVGVIYFGIAAPLLEQYRRGGSEIEALKSALTRFERIADERTSRQAELAGLEHQRAAQEGFLQGPNETLIAAEIQNRIKTLATAAHGELTSTQILPSEADGKLKRISVREQMSITLPGLVSVVHALESATPFLFLDNVDIRPHPDLRRRDADPFEAGIVDVRFDAYGFIRGAD